MTIYQAAGLEKQLAAAKSASISERAEKELMRSGSAGILLALAGNPKLSSGTSWELLNKGRVELKKTGASAVLVALAKGTSWPAVQEELLLIARTQKVGGIWKGLASNAGKSPRIELELAKRGTSATKAMLAMDAGISKEACLAIWDQGVSDASFMLAANPTAIGYMHNGIKEFLAKVNR
ncbi:MAG: hypothetical protein KGI00_00945 [Candidatus Micrarchaeota archaeon]|nr:hypothetical protein [Candidatus Micrarchaeota archaeon]MDE1824611.1 hypothetical protein [Candidatus Micrarchaeota archaeon]MDE1849276.1 hypothetical protein [Candidatus Micrarchaeota archaeon]